MNITISKINADQNYQQLVSLKVDEADGTYSVTENDPTKFLVADNEYTLTANFFGDSKKGAIIVNRNGEVFARVMASLDPTFLFTVRISADDWIELNFHLE